MNILVTGGASGLGGAITRHLLSLPTQNTVYFTYFNSKEKAKQLESEFPNAKGIYVDFTNAESMESFLLTFAEKNIDVLVNNAITSYTKTHFHKIDSRVFLESFQQNVLPTIQVTQEAIKSFRKKKFGKIITILSSGLIGNPPTGSSEYTANKAYLHSLAKAWASENSSFNITSNCISPSLMLTSLMEDLDERVVEMALNAHPLKKILTPEEVAGSVAYLVEASQQVNGINLIINAAANTI